MQVGICFNGVGYCFISTKGNQISKEYTTINRLLKYGLINKGA